jgi:hypothetical protein
VPSHDTTGAGGAAGGATGVAAVLSGLALPFAAVAVAVPAGVGVLPGGVVVGNGGRRSMSNMQGSVGGRCSHHVEARFLEDEEGTVAQERREGSCMVRMGMA